MPLRLPRRHRRQLLFPPGLLALAGLLWLGCVAVGLWREQLKRWYRIQLTVPSYPARAEKPSIHFFLPNPDTICPTCSWKDIYLTGSNDSIDKRELIRTENTVHAMMRNVEQGSGVRIHLMRSARFKHLIFALNTLNREGVRKYWVDIYHTPATLYAFNEPPTLTPPRLEPACLLCDDVLPYVSPTSQTPFWVRFDNQVTAFWQFEWLRS